MGVARGREFKSTSRLFELTRDWGAWETVSLFLDRCRVDTPDSLVAATWSHIFQLRSRLKKVVDFGAGDGRFARFGRYSEYIGYEIDLARFRNVISQPNVQLINRCAFSDEIDDADLCIGNPPFVRNQNLPEGWRHRASSVLLHRTGVQISGLANAWQYFFLLALTSAKEDGLCALVIPYEWVSRPSAQGLRDYIRAKRWGVRVYRLVDTTFNSVLTTSSITIIDKSATDGMWQYFEESATGQYRTLSSPTGSASGVLRYLRRSEVQKSGPRAMRGLSPGTQRILTLTEGERVRSGLAIGRDVVPCITTLRDLPTEVRELNDVTFQKYYRMPGQKCWLIRTDSKRSPALTAYLDAVPASDYQTSTCLERTDWWKFNMPPIPNALMAMSFRGPFPKTVKNSVSARAVGGVYGIYNVSETQVTRLTSALGGTDLRDRIVAHSNGLRKVEVNQLNALFTEVFEGDGTGS
jgi:hypothetical protein